jgi:hypothetical protein
MTRIGQDITMICVGLAALDACSQLESTLKKTALTGASSCQTHQ